MLSKFILQLRGKKKIFFDFILNFVASFLSTAVIQLIVYPFLSRIMPEEEYGVLLTVMGISNAIITSFGISLNNVRLMENSDYERKGICGDFIPILFILATIGFVLNFCYTIVFHSYSFIAGILLALFSSFGIIRSYGSVIYRIILDYKKNLYFCLIVAIGNIGGLGILIIFNSIKLWPIVFILGEVFGIIYLLLSSKILLEKNKITSLFGKTLKNELILLVTSIVANLLTYFDRILILPLLGGEAVTNYSVASFLGKSLGVLMIPISSVLLSYYSQKEYIMSIKKFWRSNSIVLILGMLFFGICVVLGKQVTGIFYPTVINAAIPYLILANLAAIINIIGNMTLPAVLKFAPMYWQIVIQFIYSITYICLGIAYANKSGLYGFSIAAVVAGIVKIVLLYFIGTYTLGKEKNVKNY